MSTATCHCGTCKTCRNRIKCREYYRRFARRRGFKPRGTYRDRKERTAEDEAEEARMDSEALSWLEARGFRR